MVCRIIRRHSLPWVILQESNGDPRGGCRELPLGEECRRNIRSHGEWDVPGRKAGRLCFIDKGYIISMLHGKEAP